MGIPTVGGECYFNKDYNKNILVNAMTLGLVNKNKIFYSKAAGVNKPVIYVGSKTGRDGIHGASMASAIFDDKIEEKQPSDNNIEEKEDLEIPSFLINQSN